MTAAVAGSRFGYTVLWAAVVGSVIKFALNEGVARWQLATGTTLIEGWGARLGRWFLVGFLIYLVLWTIIVSAALMAACGLAIHAMVPSVPVELGGILHSLAALTLVLVGRYLLFERAMKLFIGIMFVTVVGGAFLSSPDWIEVLSGFVPAVPTDSGAFLLGVIGGVGGSVTILSYSYWMREKGWTTSADVRSARFDLVAAYTLTGIFGVAIIVTAAGLEVEQMTGNAIALAIADRMGEFVGPVGKWIFLIGFWGAVFSSMLGVWQGVPYIFADCLRVLRSDVAATVESTSREYRGYLLFLGLLPAFILLAGRPVWIVLVYSVFGAAFLPILAGSLLALNNRASFVGNLRNGKIINLLLGIALVLFLILGISGVMDRF